MWCVLAATFVLLSAGNAHAQENVALKPGTGRDTVESYCGVCHSLQYLPENGFLSRQGWESEVTKMIKAFGAPIEPVDAKLIIEYLSANYSSGN
jgi:sulfite dehydrogenase (cytochrome) subunit B